MATKQQTKVKVLNEIKSKYLIPAKRDLEKHIKAGDLPKNCMVNWSNNVTIEMLENSKKIVS